MVSNYAKTESGTSVTTSGPCKKKTWYGLEERKRPNEFQEYIESWRVGAKR